MEPTAPSEETAAAAEHAPEPESSTPVVPTVTAEEAAPPRALVVARSANELEEPIDTPENFEEIPVESMRRMRYDVEAKEWNEDRFDVKAEGSHVGTGGLKSVQRAFIRAEGSAGDSATGSGKTGQAADWVTIVLKEYLGAIVDAGLGDEEGAEVGSGVIAQFKSDVVMQVEARALAKAYNAAGPPKLVEVVEPFIVLRDSGEIYFAEPLMIGQFFKHNDPAANILGMYEGFAEDHDYVRMTPQAFTHFSWHHSCGQKMVMDVQGVGDVYTDPQIISTEGGRYGVENIDGGTVAMARFACSHVCNPICDELGLTPFHLSPSEVDRVSLLWGSMKKEDEAPLSRQMTKAMPSPNGQTTTAPGKDASANLFAMYKDNVQKRKANPLVWEAHARLHARFWLWYHSNTHPYYHREGVWLEPNDRAYDGVRHLCFAVALFRALIDESASGDQALARQGSTLEQSRLLERIEEARTLADAVPIVAERKAQAAANPTSQPAQQSFAAARDIATTLYLWCHASTTVFGIEVDRDGGARDTQPDDKEQLLGGPRRYVLVRERPDGQRETFGAVATKEEAINLCPDFMVDMKYRIGATFKRVKSGDYRFGDGGKLIGYRQASRAEATYWTSTAAETIQRVIVSGEASSCTPDTDGRVLMDDWLEATRRRLDERHAAEITDEGSFVQLDGAKIPSAGFILAVPYNDKQTQGCCSSRPKRLINPVREEAEAMF